MVTTSSCRRPGVRLTNGWGQPGWLTTSKPKGDSEEKHADFARAAVLADRRERVCCGESENLHRLAVEMV